MGTVSVNGVAGYRVYGDLADLKKYINGVEGSDYDAFNAAVDAGEDDKVARAYVGASRMLDRQKWITTAATFALRDVIQDSDPTSDFPYTFRKACYELTAAIMSDDSLVQNPTSGSNVQSVGAGPAQVVFFRPTLGVTGRFPLIIKELLGDYLAGSQSSTDGMSQAYGTDAESAFDDADLYAIDRSF